MQHMGLQAIYPRRRGNRGAAHRVYPYLGWMDNVFIERFWRSLKYEDIYLNAYETVAAITQGVKRYFDFYNHIRCHQALDYATPAQCYQVTA